MTKEKIDPIVWRTAAVVFLGPFMTQLDSTVVNVSLTAMRLELNANLAHAQWVISGYLLALALVLPLNGWLVDRIGAKRVYVMSFSVFTLASLLCGAARTIDELVWMRILQGMAGGLMVPMTQMMMARVAGKNLARVMGYTAVPILLVPILGPILAGAVLRVAGWPWLFYLNLPIGVLGVTLAAWLLPKDDERVQIRRFDIVGFLMLSPALICVLYGLEKASHQDYSSVRDGALILFIGIFLLVTFIRHANVFRGAALIDLDLFRGKIFATASVTQFLSNGMLYSGQFLIPLYLITGCGLTASEAGYMLAPLGLGMMCSLPSMGFFTDRFGCRSVSSTGVLIVVFSTLPFIYMIESGFVPWLAGAALFLRGVGQGAIGVPSISAAYSSIAKERLPVATTALNIVQRLGGPARNDNGNRDVVCVVIFCYHRCALISCAVCTFTDRAADHLGDSNAVATFNTSKCARGGTPGVILGQFLGQRGHPHFYGDNEHEYTKRAAKYKI